jgi:hypothetical protein
MAVVRQPVGYEDPLTAAARTADDTLNPFRSVDDELHIIADRRLGEVGNAVGAGFDRRPAARRSRWCRHRAASVD